MLNLLPTRGFDVGGRGTGVFVSAVLLVSLGLGVRELSAQQRPPVFHAPPKPSAAPSRPVNSFQGAGQNQTLRLQNPNVGGTPAARSNPHLTEWMNRHRELPLERQQRALEFEPGFRELPTQTQQRMREQLKQLNSMRPDERARILEHNEEIEHLTGPQRQQVRGALLQLGTLPDDRRKMVARAFRDLRAMNDGQRQQYMSSPAFRGQFSDQERNTMSNLMSVEPYIPGHKAGDAPPQ